MNDLNNPKITDLRQLQWLFDAGKNPANFATNMKNAIRNLDDNAIDKLTVIKFRAPSKTDLKIKILNDFDTIFKLK